MAVELNDTIIPAAYQLAERTGTLARVGRLSTLISPIAAESTGRQRGWPQPSDKPGL
jgi:hypothetical protein